MNEPSLEQNVILAFDQSSEHVGYARITYRAGDVLGGGSEKIKAKSGEANRAAADFVAMVLEGEWYSQLRAVAFEDTYFDPKKGWKVVSRLAELRGMCMREAHTRHRDVRVLVIRPADWQADHGWNALASPAIKERSLRYAQAITGRAAWLDEHAADAIWIALNARAKLRVEEFGKPQRELIE